MSKAKLSTQARVNEERAKLLIVVGKVMLRKNCSILEVTTEATPSTLNQIIEGLMEEGYDEEYAKHLVYFQWSYIRQQDCLQTFNCPSAI